MVAIRMLRQLMLWLTGRYQRFGYAAVSFGRPLSLRAFMLREGEEDAPTVLAQELMGRIGECVPVLPVALVAATLVRSQSGSNPWSRSDIEQAMDGLLAQIPFAHIHTPRDSLGDAAEVGLRQLTARGILQEHQNRYQLDAERGDLLVYYANSIRHLIPEPTVATSA